MARIRERQIERDENGRVIEERVELKRRGAGFAPGLAAGMIAVLAALAFYAYSQGSFQDAGRDADVAAAQAQTQLSAAADSAGNAVENAGDRIEQATDRTAERTQPQPDDTAQN
jgi:hypothetical protein